MTTRSDRLRPTHHLLLIAILLLAATLRFTGLNWDLAQWIHPDEGHMRAVTSAVAWPDDLTDYFDTATSSLNPRNNNQVYSYGTLPVFATRALAEWLERGCASPAGSRAGRLGLSVAHRIAALVLARLGEPVGGFCPQGTFTFTYIAYLGRHLSALADLGTVLLVYLLGRRLYGPTVGLLSAGLAAVTAFMIQQAHFYTVDSAATFFTVLTAYFAVRAAQGSTARPPWLELALGGVATGLATACKVSAALAAGLVALGGFAWALRRAAWARAASEPEEGEPGSRGRLSSLAPALGAVLPALVLAGALSLVAFRIGQPYAFEGPGFFGIRPNPDWFGRLKQIGEEQSGILDYPSGRQWTNRWPVVFPWVNMVLWGMGLPLGLAAWAGWGLVGFELLRGDRRHLVLWTWNTLFFAFYATRWVKAMRYFLPLYPFLLIFAAWALIRGVSRDEPVTDESGGAEGQAGAKRRPAGVAVALIVVAGAAAWGAAMFGVYLRPHPRIAASRWIYANVPTGSTVANEHWDWGLPLRIDGRDGLRNDYIGFQMEHYNEDTPEKRTLLLAWLDDADYLFMASNRLYGSIPRLPERYPLTTTYYRALFAGELGFELAGKFTSYLEIPPFVFPDQENPYPLMAAETATQDHLIAVPMPAAEESFSVYDHPDCFIFRKTTDYSRERVEAILGSVDLSDVAIGQTPHEATPRAVVIAHDVFFYAGLALGALGVGAALATQGRPTLAGRESDPSGP